MLRRALTNTNSSNPLIVMEDDKPKRSRRKNQPEPEPIPEWQRILAAAPSFPALPRNPNGPLIRTLADSPYAKPRTGAVNLSAVELPQAETTHRNAHVDMPKWPFRMAFLGPSGCGKTTALLKLITADLFAFDTLGLFSPTLDQPTYSAFIEKIEPAIEADVVVLGENSEEIVDPDSLNEDLQNLLVFDDFVSDREAKKKIADLYQRGRHKNASTIFLTQSFTGPDSALPHTVRENMNYLVLFGGVSKEKLQVIWRQFANRVCDFETLLREYRNATKERYGYLVIDGRDNNLRNTFFGKKVYGSPLQE